MVRKIDYRAKRDGRIPIFVIVILTVLVVLILVGMGLLFKGGLPG